MIYLELICSHYLGVYYQLEGFALWLNYTNYWRTNLTNLLPQESRSEWRYSFNFDRRVLSEIHSKMTILSDWLMAFFSHCLDQLEDSFGFYTFLVVNWTITKLDNNFKIFVWHIVWLFCIRKLFISDRNLFQ